MKRYTEKLNSTISNLIKTNTSLVKMLLAQSLQGLGFVGEVLPLEKSIEK